jgi:hypothetical protein
VRSYYEAVGVPLCELLEKRLAAREPVRVGPGIDRAAIRDVNSDLFAKDEFLFRGGGR